ncbi:MAG: sugar transferase [Deltaproteobacteria bacterium]|nr:sugar transferase [Deltaproteobacteria bacterium]
MERVGLREQSTIAFLLTFDVLWGFVAYLLAFVVRIHVPLPFTADFLPGRRVFELRHMVLQLLAAEIVILYFFGFYDLRALRSSFRSIVNSVTALFVHLLAASALYFFVGDVNFPRSVLVIYWLINAVGLAAVREWMGRRLAARSAVRVLLVGTAEEIEQFLTGVGSPRLHHVDVVGAVAVGPSGTQESAAAMYRLVGTPGAPPWLGTVEDLPRLLAEHNVGEIVLLSPLSWRDQLVDRLLRERRRPRVSVVPSVYDILVGRISSGKIHDVPLIEVVKNPRDDLAYLVKRITDFVIAAALGILALPILVAAAIAIRVSSPGPIFYRQRRVGEGGAEFVIWKLRTMAHGAEEESGPILASARDERVTPIGRFLRATRIDEVPQLGNVLNGTMSLIGPRPERPEFVQRYAEEIPGYLERFQVKPGLTGLAQVNGEYHTSAAYKLKYDLAYIYNYSLVLDLKIMAETVKVMVTRRGV